MNAPDLAFAKASPAFELTPSQRAGVEKIHDLIQTGRTLISLSGPAGTGKTTMIDALLDGLRDAVVVTPTNKAAQVLVAKGIEAQTFFRMFFMMEEKKVKGVKPKFISCRRYAEENAGTRHWRDVALPEGKRAFANVIIVDEASMLTFRRERELEAMCNTLILVGDPHQLPPVGDNDYPAGFFAGMRHDVELTEVLRNEGKILKLATAIREGQEQMAESGIRYFSPAETFDTWIKRGAKVICYTNKERIRINTIARRILGFDQAIPMPGDLMVSTNNYSDMIINGTEVEVISFQWNGEAPTALLHVKIGINSVMCRMDMHLFIEDQLGSQQALLSANIQPANESDEEEYAAFSFSYAITAHKSQGSEWDDVVLIDQRPLIKKIALANARPGGMAPLEQVRRWVYTAVTRSKKNLAIADSRWARTQVRGEEE